MSLTLNSDLDAVSHAGGIIPCTQQAAYSLALPAGIPVPILIAAPHGGRSYTGNLTRRMRKAEYTKLRLEDRLIDKIAQEVVRKCGAGLLVAHAPRAMLDLNRSPDDADYEMISGADRDEAAKAKHKEAKRSSRVRSGLGLIPRRIAGLGEIWTGQLEYEELEDRIAHIHAPYHQALNSALMRIREVWGAALLLDLHSMPPLRESIRGGQSARFVIGDRFGATASDRLVSTALQFLGSQGEQVAHNRPYAGGYVLERHGQTTQNIHAIQLEVCRSAYLDAQFKQLKESSMDVIDLLAQLISRLAGEVAELGQTGWGKNSGAALAAE